MIGLKFTHGRVKLCSSLEEIDALHETINRRRTGSQYVKVDAEILHKVLRDHATMINQLQEEQ